MPVEVPCPECGAKLKAPDNAAGKKVKCKKCDTQFRLPGVPARPGDPNAQPQALSAIGPSPLPLDDDEPIPTVPPPPAKKPAARDVTALPSADPFDFSAPAAKPAPKAAASPPPAPPAPAAPARPGFGAAKPTAPAMPAAASRPGFGTAKSASPPPPPAKPAPAPPAPAAKSPPPPPAKKPAPEPEPLPLDDDEPEPAPKAASAPAPASADPFAFNVGGEDESKSDKGRKKRDRADDDDEDAGPRSRRKERDRDDEDDDRPRRKSRARDDDDEDEPRSRRKDRDDEDDRKRDKDRKRRDDEDEEPEEGRRYVRPDERKGGKSLTIALVIGLTAIGAAVAAVIVLNNQNKPTEEAKNKKDEKKDEKKDDTGTSPGDPKGGKVDPKVDPKIDPKVDSGKKDPKVETKKETKIEPNPAVPVMTMAASIPPLRFQPLGANLEVSQRPSGEPVSVESAPGKVKRIFAPQSRRKEDLVVVSQNVADSTPKVERLWVDVYTPTGARIMRFQMDGDGREPKCDVSPDAKFFASANLDGKISVVDLSDKGRTVVDGFDPYAEYPDRKKEGLAAVLFTAVPGRILTVSTAGYAYLFDLATKKRIEGYSPLGTLSPGKVVLGKNLATDDARASIVMAVNGVIYQVDTSNMTTAWKLDVAEVGRPLGLAVIGIPGRIAYAFETVSKEKGILFCLPTKEKDPKPYAYRWADTPGEVNAVWWAGTKFVAFASDRGVAYFEVADEKRFVPVAFAELAGGKLVHTANEDGHWYLVPDPAKPGQSLLLEMTADSISDFKNGLLDDKNPPTARLDAQGLAK